MKKIFFFLLVFLFNGLLLFSQGNSRDTVMWFIGHWKDKKTFVIDSNLSAGNNDFTGNTGSAASNKGTIIVKPNGSMDVSTGESKQWNDKIEKEVTEIDKAEQTVKDEIHKEEGLIQYNLGKETVNELEKVKAQIRGYKAEKTKEEQEQEANRNFATNLNNWCVQAQADFKEVMDFYQAHKSLRNEHFNLPSPPIANYQCMYCNKKQWEEYEKEAQKYVDSFFNEEANLIKKALSICRSLELIGHGETPSTSSSDFQNIVDEAFKHNRNDPSKNGPCYGLNTSDMWQAVLFLAQRGVRKAEQLLKGNKTNYAVLNPVIRVYLSSQRNAQLLGVNTGDDNLKELGEIMTKFYYHEKDKLIKDRDYSQIANIPFMIGLMRQAVLLGNEIPSSEIDELLNFCHFKLTLDMDVKIGRDGGYELAHLKGTAKVVTELDSIKCIKFVLDKDEQAKVTLDVIANEIIAPGPHPVYIGSRKAETPMPFIDIHFCTEGQDSFYIYKFVPSDKSGLWSVPQAPPAPLWFNGLDGMFQDPKQTMADAEAVASDYQNNPEKIEALKKNAGVMQQKLAALQRSGASPQQIAEEMKKLMDFGEQETQKPLAKVAQLKFPVKLYNNNKTLINERFDAKSINTVAAPIIVYGYFTIKLEHDPKK